jgi:hypothetical protein
MADNSATATYSGQGLTAGGWRRRGTVTAESADPGQTDLTSRVDHDVTLDGETAMAAGSEARGQVPNLNVEHHSRPGRVRSEDRAATRAAQNPQSASEPHPRAAARGRNYVSPRGK